MVEIVLECNTHSLRAVRSNAWNAPQSFYMLRDAEHAMFMQSIFRPNKACQHYPMITVYPVG